MGIKFVKITRQNVRALGNLEQIQEHGIVAKRLPNGDVRYSVNVMVDGERIHRVVGTESEGVTREQAERLIEQFRTEARQSRLNLPDGRKLHLSFKDAAERYLERMEATSGKDLGNKRRHLQQRLIPALGGERLDKITEFRLRQYRKARTDDGASQASINRELATFSHLMRRASSKDWNWIKPDALPPIPKERETRKKIRILTVEQRQRLLNASIEDQDPRAYLFVMFGLNASMRHSEIVARRYDEVDFENCRIWINRAKAGEREQPITPALRDALLQQRATEKNRDGWIFPAVRDGCKTPHRPDMRPAFARIVVRAGMDPTQCTTLIIRHTAISTLVMAKTDIPTIQKISGHKTAAMVLHYVHLFGEHIDNAISTLDMSPSDPTTQELHTPILDHV